VSDAAGHLSKCTPALLCTVTWLSIADRVALGVALAGLAARMAPHVLQQNMEAARAAADEADLERIMRWGLGPMDTGDDEALWVRKCLPQCAPLAPSCCLWVSDMLDILMRRGCAWDCPALRRPA